MIDKSIRYRYQWGGPGGKSPGTSASGGSRNGSHDRGGGQHRAAAQRAAPVTTAKAPPSILARDTKPVTTAKAPPSILARDTKPKIDPGPKRDMHDFEIKKRKTTTITGGSPHTKGPIDRIVYQPTDLPKRTYDPRTDPNALLKRPSGVLGTLGKIGLTALTAGAGAGLFGKTPALFAKGFQYKQNYDKLQKSALGKKFGLKEFNLNNINRDILKQTKKDDIPKVADRHPGTDKKKRTTTDDRDGVNRILPETLQSAVSEGTQQYLSDEMKEQYLVAQNKMKAALAEGYYIDKDGKHIDLSDEQINALTQWVTKIKDMLVDPMPMGAAHGGRIDKALGGRVRDI